MLIRVVLPLLPGPESLALTIPKFFNVFISYHYHCFFVF